MNEIEKKLKKMFKLSGNSEMFSYLNYSNNKYTWEQWDDDYANVHWITSSGNSKLRTFEQAIDAMIIYLTKPL